MAIKFSQFITQTSASSLSHIVGYNGADNIQITPADFFTSFVTGTAGQVAYFDPSNNLAGENAFFWDNTNKRLGIGTNSPNHKIHVVDDSVTTGTGTLLELQSPPINNGGSLNLDFRVSSANTDDRYVARISGMREGNGALSQLQFWTESSGLYQRMTITSEGNVGIGTTSPSSKLQVSGTLDATGISQLGSSGANVFLTSSSAGNVGVGTSSPTDKLDIAGAARFTSNISFDSGKAGRIYKASNHGLAIHGVTGTENDFAMFTPTGMLKIVVPTGTNNLILNRDNGNVGIGTTSPDSLLHVAADVSSANTGTITIEGRPTGFLGDDIATIDFQNNGSKRADIRMERGNTATDSQLVFSTSDAGTLNDTLIINEAGDVGIGITSPTAKLQIAADFSSSPQPLIFLSNSGANNPGGGSEIIFGSSTSATTSLYNAKIQVIRSSLDNGSSDLFFQTTHVATSQSPSTKMTIKSDGNVGIGTTSPNRKLTLIDDGAANGSQNITAQFSNQTSGATSSALYIGASAGADWLIGKNIYGVSSQSYFQIGNQAGTTPALTINHTTNNATFTGSATIRKSSLGGSTPMADGSLVLGAGSTDYYSFRLDSNADLYLDKIFGGTAANVLSIDRSSTNGNITFAGNIEALGLTFSNGGDRSLTGPQNEDLIINARPNDTTEGLHLQINGTDKLFIKQDGSSTFAGLVKAPFFTTDGGRGFKQNSVAFVGTYSNGAAANGANDLGSTTNKWRDIYISGDITSSAGGATFADAINTTGKVNINIPSEGNYFEGGSASLRRLTITTGTNISPHALHTFNIASSNGKYKFDVNGTEQFSIDSSNATFAGNITVSTASATLNLLSGTNGNSTINFADPADNNVGQIIYRHNGNSMAFDTNDVERMRIDSTGSLLVNTTTNQGVGGVSIDPITAGLTTIVSNTSSSGAELFVARFNSTQVGSITLSGTTGTQFNTSSDYRLKEDLQDFAGLDMISKILVYDFKWKSDDSRSYGVMAHELEEVLPQAVSGEKDAEEMQGVDYSKIVPLLIKSIQELKAEVEDLKSKI
jgi:hypothetical protein